MLVGDMQERVEGSFLGFDHLNSIEEAAKLKSTAVRIRESLSK